jgi:hypothetical protein
MATNDTESKQDGETAQAISAFELAPERYAHKLTRRQNGMKTIYRIRYYYDIGDQDVFVARPDGNETDALRAVLYLNGMMIELFGPSALISNLGMAAMLIVFYGFTHAAKDDLAETIDFYLEWERPRESDFIAGVMSDASLQRDRDKLLTAMFPFVEGADPARQHSYANAGTTCEAHAKAGWRRVELAECGGDGGIERGAESACDRR